MINKIYLLIITGILFLLITGCGGGDNVTSSVNPQSTDSENNTETGSLIIKIKWPQSGVEGSCVSLSGDNENTLMASMPYETNNVDIEIYESWFKITQEVIENLNTGWYRVTGEVVDSLTGQIDINQLVLIEGEGFSREDLTKKLTELNYTGAQIETILNNIVPFTVDTGNLTALIGQEHIYTDFVGTLSLYYGKDDIEVILESSVFYKEDNSFAPLKKTDFTRAGIEELVTGIIDSLPLTWVTITSMPRLIDETGNIKNLIEKPVVKHRRIKPQFNVIGIDLGEEKLTVSSKDAIIALFPQIASSAIVQPTPVPELGGETEIIARLVLGSPDTPPQPTMTPFGGSEVSGSNLEAQGEVGLENYEVRLTIVEGIGELIPAAGGTLEGDTVVTYTDNYGYCNAILKTNRPGIIKIKAECDLLATATTLSTSGDRILTAYCTVTALLPGGG